MKVSDTERVGFDRGIVAGESKAKRVQSTLLTRVEGPASPPPHETTLQHEKAKRATARTGASEAERQRLHNDNLVLEPALADAEVDADEPPSKLLK